MKLSKKAILFLSFLLISFCGNNEEINESNKNSNLQTSNEKVEDSNQEENSSQEKGSSLQEAIDEIIQEFPDGLVSFLSKEERDCLS